MGENRLKHETSEYLLQHKDNPVHWWSWGDEAFAYAKKEGKPVLLSVGYAACHWCHVMAHECFEDDDIATLMNDLFVNIKLDREERPDIDKIYMTALHHLGEQGGWPLNMFLTPRGEPFWGGTYFPKIPKYGRPGFATVLKTISDIFQKEPEKVKQNTEAIIQRLNKGLTSNASGTSLVSLETVLEKLSQIMDMEKGGPSGAPKFPQCSLLALFWLGYQNTGNSQYKDIVDISLKNMCQGGIYDHLGGGFSRYSVDDIWLVPHFEKMIYDNAQLISVMNSVYLNDPNPLFRARINETIEWLMREMRAEEGPFFASLDADSEGIEGKYYIWDKEEILKILPKTSADSFVKTYGIDSNGNWEGKNILNRLSDLSLSDPETEKELKQARDLLLAKREKRIRPGLDDKILSDWNGLLISALAESAIIFDNKDWLNAASRAFLFISGKMRIEDKLAHSYAKRAVKHLSMLDDYAFMIKAALTLYEMTNDNAYLKGAEKWAKELEENFWSKEKKAYYLSSKQDSLLITRLMMAADDATPSGNAVMIENLVRLFSYSGKEEYYKKAEDIIRGFSTDVAQNIFSHAGYMKSKDFFENYTDVVILPSSKNKNPLSLISDIAKISAPHLIIHLYTDGSVSKSHPAFGKSPIEDKDSFYICKNQTCSQPIHTLDEVKTHLR